MPTELTQELEELSAVIASAPMLEATVLEAAASPVNDAANFDASAIPEHVAQVAPDNTYGVAPPEIV